MANEQTRSQDMVIRPISPQETVPLRHTVLWPDKPVSYVLLPEDDNGLHFGAFQPGDSAPPVAVISLFREDPPITEPQGAEPQDVPQPAARFRKFACDPSFQGRGIGTKLLQFMFAHARTHLGTSIVWCDARVETAGWYERRGMHRFGGCFFKGPVEYVRMKIHL